jgi:hypothetical protein
MTRNIVTQAHCFSAPFSPFSSSLLFSLLS